MSKLLKVVLLTALLLGVATVWAVRIIPALGGSSRGTVGDGEGIQWLTVIPNEGDDEKPTLIYFTADWCPPCRLMKKEAWVDKEVVEAASDFTPVMIDHDANPTLVNAFRVASIPTVIVVDSDGNELSRRTGYGSGGQAELAAWLRRHGKSPTPGR